MAFQTLSERRRITESGPEPIAISEILAYAEYTRTDAEYERELLLKVVNTLDDTFLKFVRQKHKQLKRQQERRRAK